MAFSVGKWTKGYSSNQTTTSVPAPYSQTKPSNLIMEGGTSEGVAMLFFGSDAENETATFRVYGVDLSDEFSTGSPTPATVYITSCIASISAVWGATQPGAVGDMAASDFVCDDLASGAGLSMPNMFYNFGPVNAGVGGAGPNNGNSVICYCLTGRHHALHVGIAVGTAASANFLWAPVSRV